MKTTLKTTLSIVLLMSVLACFKSAEYSPTLVPEGTEYGTAMIALLESGTARGCINESSISGPMLNAKYVCSGGVGMTSLRFGKIRSITVGSYGKMGAVKVKHDGALRDFYVSFASVDDAKAFADLVYTYDQVIKPTDLKSETSADI